MTRTSLYVKTCLVKTCLVLAAEFSLTLTAAGAAFATETNHLVPVQAPIPSSYFGMHIRDTVIASETASLTPWPSVPVPEWRLWDVK